MSQDLIIGIAGSGGDGVASAGESLITAAALEGYHGIMTKSFGSQVRGGEASCRLRLAILPVLNPNGPLDLAVALNWEDFRRFGGDSTGPRIRHQALYRDPLSEPQPTSNLRPRSNGATASP